jgi:hypothetical protein
MKTSELIEQLSALPPDQEVLISLPTGEQRPVVLIQSSTSCSDEPAVTTLYPGAA